MSSVPSSFRRKPVYRLLSGQFGPNLLAVALPSPAFYAQPKPPCYTNRLVSVSILQIALPTDYNVYVAVRLKVAYPEKEEVNPNARLRQKPVFAGVGSRSLIEKVN